MGYVYKSSEDGSTSRLFVFGYVRCSDGRGYNPKLTSLIISSLPFLLPPPPAAAHLTCSQQARLAVLFLCGGAKGRAFVLKHKSI